MRSDQQAELIFSLALDSDGVLNQQRLSAAIEAFMQSQYSTNQLQTLRLLRQKVHLYESKHNAIVTTAVKLDDSAKDILEKSIRQQFPNIKQVNWQEDPSLISGFTILAGDMWYDASIIHDLEVIREQLSL